MSTPRSSDAFLEHLETTRRNSVRTRNARLAAIRSFFRFATLRHREHAALIARVLAVPTKRYGGQWSRSSTATEGEALVASLTATPGGADETTPSWPWSCGPGCGPEDRARHQDVALRPGANLRNWGNGRKHRVTPLRPASMAVLAAGWPMPGTP